MRRLALFLLLVLLAPVAHAQQRPKNVIFFITDGFGPASVTFARDYAVAVEGRDRLAFDSLLTGTVRTWATDSRVTDSAAGATALATGHKSYNGAIAVDTSGQPLATLVEAAEKKGMATGLVVTTRITHATPAGFSAHVARRASENDIAAQQAAQGIDLFIGGGARHFLPESAGGKRTDGRDLLAEMQAGGYTVVRDRAGYDALAKTPAIALLQLDQLAYEIDRDETDEPSLEEMTKKAIDLLKGDPDGFFLMVEASRIDHAGHENDAAAHLHDILAFDKAIAAAVAFARRDGHTLVLSTSDHETGGLTLGRNLKGYGVYEFHPERLQPAKMSQMRIAERIVAGENAGALLQSEMGIPSRDLKDDERQLLDAAVATGKAQDVNFALSEIVARRVVIGWTTKGHTGVDVNLYAWGPGREQLRGNWGNDEVGQRVAALLGLDLDGLTRSLRAK